MEKFKVGDKVYYVAGETTGCIYTLSENQFGDVDNSKYPVCIKPLDAAFLADGKTSFLDVRRTLVHATKENYELLSKLFPEVKWEKPKRVLKGSELCKHLLKTRPYVFCFVSDESDDVANSKNLTIRCISQYDTLSAFFVERDKKDDIAMWFYAVPINPETLEPLEMEVED